jgi:hypothetical protein
MKTRRRTTSSSVRTGVARIMHDPRWRDPLVTAHAILILEDGGPFTFRVAKDGRQRSVHQSPKAACVRDVR